MTKRKIEKGSQQDRFIFIESRLCWTGRFKRRFLYERFGISPTQQTKDMAEYQRLCPGNIYYDRRTYSYHPTLDFKPYFVNPESEALLGYLLADPGYLGIKTEIAIMPRPHRAMPADIVRQVLLACDFIRSLFISYQSMNRAEPEERRITPHALGHDGFRLHARAYCHRDRRFKDFVLGRILAIHSHEPSMPVSTEDTEWHEKISVLIGPHPNLLPGPRRIIETDYEMTNGISELIVRKAMLPYVLKHLHLIDCASKPEHQQIILLNTEILEQLNFSNS